MEPGYMTAEQLKALVNWIRAEVHRGATLLALQGYTVIGEDNPGKREKAARSALANAFGLPEGALDD